MNVYEYEYTDTFAGEANYCWVKRGKVAMGDLTHYGYTGSADGSYTKANKVFERDLMRKVKAEIGLTGVRGVKDSYGDSITFTPYKMATILFINYSD